MSNENFVRSATLLTASFFIVKFLGFVYVVPFVAIVGEENYILFDYAYKPYSIMVMIATLGIPSAISKYVAKHREKGEYEKVRFVLFNGSFLMVLLGVISFFVLYLNAGNLANMLVGNDFNRNGNSVEDVTFVIQMISYAMLVVPSLSLMRGFFQGYQSMGPSSISQVVEQLVRVIIIVLGSYLIVHQFGLDPVVAVGVSTFAALVSAFFGLLVMFYFFFKRQFNLHLNKHKKVKKSVVYKEIGRYMIPFIFVGVSITLFQTIDTFTINKALVGKGLSLNEAELINAIVSLVQKLIVVPVAIASALSASLISYITASYHGGRVNEVRENITKSFKIVFFFVLPSSLAFIVLAKPIYSTVFGLSNANVGGDILSWYGFVPLFYSLYSITAAILQGMDKIKWIVVSLVLGIVVKLISNEPLILLFDGIGTAFSTYLGFGVSILIQMYVIQKEGKYDWLENAASLKKIVTQTLYMTIILLPIGIFSVDIEVYTTQLILTGAGVGIGLALYLFIAYQNESLGELFPRFAKKK